jgi:uncharacterized protein (TIGR02246 family)
MRIIATLVLASAAVFGAAAEDAVRAVLAAQVAAWNNGDLPAFVTTYSGETVFIGREITRGSKGVLERYRRSYPTREKMGVLTFSDLEVTMLGAEHASVIGRFALKRTAEGGGDAKGIFTLLLKKTSGGWKIILDHTTSI